MAVGQGSGPHGRAAGKVDSWNGDFHGWFGREGEKLRRWIKKQELQFAPLLGQLARTQPCRREGQQVLVTRGAGREGERGLDAVPQPRDLATVGARWLCGGACVYSVGCE